MEASVLLKGLDTIPPNITTIIHLIDIRQWGNMPCCSSVLYWLHFYRVR
jgi:hypothetical protein